MSIDQKFSLQGKRAVVTGAGRGIGRSIALALAQAGADVTVTARTSAELDALVAQIQAIGHKGYAVACDVTDGEQVQHMAQTCLETMGGLDILVNNAGNAGSHKFLNHPDDLWQRMLAVNLTSVYTVTKAFVPTLVDQRWAALSISRQSHQELVDVTSQPTLPRNTVSSASHAP